MASRAAAKKKNRFFFFCKKNSKNTIEKKKLLKMKKKSSQSTLIDSPGRWTGNNIFSKDGRGKYRQRPYIIETMHSYTLPM